MAASCGRARPASPMECRSLPSQPKRRLRRLKHSTASSATTCPYCTVCDNNNGNCTAHNTTKLLAIEHQQIPFRPKPHAVDSTNPFYRCDPEQCKLCGRCVEACQNVEVNETLSINWEDPNAPRAVGWRFN